MLALLMLVAAPASQPSSLPAYPEAWIMKARSDHHRLSCQELVYKRGCAEIRRGRVTLHVTLDEAGSVRRAAVTKNDVGRDPKLVEKCLLKAIKKWTFTPPDSVSPELDVQFIFADKC